jgi:hypothetical protein
MADNEPHFEYALGFAVVRLWAELPRTRKSACLVRPLLVMIVCAKVRRPFCMNGIPKPLIRVEKNSDPEKGETDNQNVDGVKTLTARAHKSR